MIGDAIERIRLLAADELVTDRNLGRAVRRLLQPPEPPELDPLPTNVVDLMAYLGKSVDRQRHGPAS